ncbi:putative aspartyl-trna [Phaeomoniella chlamydospora]|uniref:Putative aspartyl-trna n=1 Tax=Phaeomoniella chlamydospora TaxID=158046 RepID=A0A0G2H9A3_PHACM|nr:putative aspartyl-trna [Phaeomoniella chlamydospora]
MRPSKLNLACRQADLKDVYLAFSKLLRAELRGVRKPLQRCQFRNFTDTARRRGAADGHPNRGANFEVYKKQLSSSLPTSWPTFDNLFAQSQPAAESEKVTIYGYIGSTRNANKNVKFADLVDPSITNACQMTFLRKTMPDGFDFSIPEGSPVKVEGFVQRRPSKGEATTPEVTVPMFGRANRDPSYEFVVEAIEKFNVFPDDIIVSAETKIPPEQRHLQIRTSHELRCALRQRSRVSAICRQVLADAGFDEIETPVLFKSTPEGAREFLVPTRQKGMAYALPQSPQQYKQLLMSSGIPKYFQLAKCFRDEDMRADRQPEFTQLDLELAFADRGAVMNIIEKLISRIWHKFGRPAAMSQQKKDEEISQFLFHKIPYQTAMGLYGSDKPDLRYTMFPIQQSHQRSFPEHFVRLMSSIERPIIDFIRVDDHFGVSNIKKFLDSPKAAAYHANPAGPPAVLHFDPSRPLSGLSALGHGFADQFLAETEADPGDTFIFQARQDLPFYGGSTTLGDLRRNLISFGIETGLLDKAQEDVFAWVVDFPLFKPIDATEPGQGGSAGIQSTHHPFTAPKTAEDFEHMITHPLKAVGDHYDLVINGVEVGGGSKRIHDSTVQEYVFREVLKVSSERVEDFRHLLEALRAGCPPHSGIALGFDRLMTIICDKESVRDVIAFPKWGSNGEDKLVKAPSQIIEEQLKTYHLSLRS